MTCEIIQRCLMKKKKDSTPPSTVLQGQTPTISGVHCLKCILSHFSPWS